MPDNQPSTQYHVGCPHCSAKLQCLERHLGKRIKCAKCGHEFKVPEIVVKPAPSPQRSQQSGQQPAKPPQPRPQHEARQAASTPIQPQNRSTATPKAPASPPPPPPPQVTQPPSQRSRLASQEDDAAHTPARRDIPNAKPTKSQLFVKAVVGLYFFFLALCVLGMLLNMIVTPEESALRKPLLAIAGIIVVPVVLVGMSIVYALPSVVAFVRDHNNFMPIMVVNICFGWTFLGWAISLAWAFSADVKESRQYIRMVTVREDQASAP